MKILKPNAEPKQSAIRLTEKQVTIKNWLTSLSPEWQEALDNGWSSINVIKRMKNWTENFVKLNLWKFLTMQN